MPLIVNDPIAFSAGLSVGLSPAENSEAIEILLRLGVGWVQGKTYYIQGIASGQYCIVFIQHNTAFESFTMQTDVTADHV